VSAFDLASYLADRRQRVDEALDAVLRPDDAEPPNVHRAMRYSVMAGGKRLRPILVIAGAEAVGGAAETVMPAACALELIHTYSLIHDDLPAMDDDDYRRGRLTNHKVFGEALAILAGDALLTDAFRLLAENAARVTTDAALVRDVIVEVVEAASTRGMVGGQVVDIESEGKSVGAETLEYIHLHKTAALIRASLRVGAMLAGGRADPLALIGEAGQNLGLAFQIVDDILDVEGTLAELGKSAGSDERKGKATYPAVHGIEASREEARRLIERAKAQLAGLGPGAAPLAALADYIFERRS
jgi:geranylgeranyl diphosphate synthase type II